MKKTANLNGRVERLERADIAEAVPDPIAPVFLTAKATDALGVTIRKLSNALANVKGQEAGDAYKAAQALLFELGPYASKMVDLKESWESLQSTWGVFLKQKSDFDVDYHKWVKWKVEQERGIATRHDQAEQDASRAKRDSILAEEVLFDAKNVLSEKKQVVAKAAENAVAKALKAFEAECEAKRLEICGEGEARLARAKAELQAVEALTASASKEYEGLKSKAASEADDLKVMKKDCLAKIKEYVRLTSELRNIQTETVRMEAVAEMVANRTAKLSLRAARRPRVFKKRP